MRKVIENLSLLCRVWTVFLMYEGGITMVEVVAIGEKEVVKDFDVWRMKFDGPRSVEFVIRQHRVKGFSIHFLSHYKWSSLLSNYKFDRTRVWTGVFEVGRRNYEGGSGALFSRICNSADVIWGFAIPLRCIVRWHINRITNSSKNWCSPLFSSKKVWLFQIKAVPLQQQIPPRFSSQDQRTRVGRFFCIWNIPNSLSPSPSR